MTDDYAVIRLTKNVPTPDGGYTTKTLYLTPILDAPDGRRALVVALGGAPYDESGSRTPARVLGRLDFKNGQEQAQFLALLSLLAREGEPKTPEEHNAL